MNYCSSIIVAVPFVSNLAVERLFLMWGKAIRMECQRLKMFKIE